MGRDGCYPETRLDLNPKLLSVRKVQRSSGLDKRMVVGVRSTTLAHCFSGIFPRLKRRFS